MDKSLQTTGILVEETIDGNPLGPTESWPDETSAPEKKKKKAGTISYGGADTYIWGIYALLLIISCIEVFSASSSRVSMSNVYAPLIDHAKFLIIGVGITFLVQRIHYKWWRSYATFMFFASIGMLIYSSIWGADYNDAKRAIQIAGFTIQPPEIVKLTTVVFLAKLLAVNQKPGGVKTRACVIAAGLVVAVSGCLWMNGLTNALMVMCTSIAMFVIGGMEWRKFGIIMAIYCACGGIVFMTKYAGDNEGAARTETHNSRVSSWISGVDPEDEITDSNRQVMFAKFALAHGGLKGEGPGNSRESSRLPLAYSDYIYSIIVEDTGFIGGVALLILYLLLLARAGKVASKCRRAFPALLIMGCAVMIVLQALVHMMIVVGIGPVSGQPLPFISKGGTSIIVMSAAVGMMLSVSRFAVKTNNRKDINAELRALPEDIHADNPTLIEK